MAHDILLLQRYRPQEAIRFRHYEWSQPSFSFGLSQNHSYVASEITNPRIDVCRRPTGGGVVDHTADWTYALVIPSTHPLAQGEPIDSYKAVHEAVVAAMQQQGVEAAINLDSPEDSTPGVCFNKPELYDVVLKNFPTKVAGAAQKRTKSGMLFQGSIWKPTLSQIKWNRFYNDFTFALCSAMDGELGYQEWPNWAANEEDALIKQFDSDDWNQRR